MKKYILKLYSGEFFRYVFFGIITMSLNFLIYYSLIYFSVNYIVSNIITHIILKLVVYIVNKLFVFKSITANLLQLIQEFLRFMFSRFLTTLLEFAGLIFLVEFIGLDNFISKVGVTIIITILNYYISKKIIYKNNKQ